MAIDEKLFDADPTLRRRKKRGTKAGASRRLPWHAQSPGDFQSTASDVAHRLDPTKPPTAQPSIEAPRSAQTKQTSVFNQDPAGHPPDEAKQTSVFSQEATIATPSTPKRTSVLEAEPEDRPAKTTKRTSVSEIEESPETDIKQTSVFSQKADISAPESAKRTSVLQADEVPHPQASKKQTSVLETAPQASPKKPPKRTSVFSEAPEKSTSEASKRTSVSAAPANGADDRAAKRTSVLSGAKQPQRKAAKPASVSKIVAPEATKTLPLGGADSDVSPQEHAPKAKDKGTRRQSPQAKSQDLGRGVETRLPHGRSAAVLLDFLVIQEQSTEAGHTPRLSRRIISEATGIPHASIRTILTRLQTAGLVNVVESKSGIKGYAVFTTSSLGKKHLLEMRRKFQLNAHGTSQNIGGATLFELADPAPPQPTSAKPMDSAGSVDATKPAKNATELSHRINDICEQTGLGKHRIAANDLIPLLREGVFEDEQDLFESLEHIAWYLDSDAAEGIKQPKAWVMKQLRQGYYAEPAGFISLEQRRHEAKMAARRKRVEAARQRAQENFEAEFKLWRMQADLSQYSRRLNGIEPNGAAGTAILRDIFSQETGLLWPEEDDRAA